MHIYSTQLDIVEINQLEISKSHCKNQKYVKRTITTHCAVSIVGCILWATRFVIGFTFSLRNQSLDTHASAGLMESIDRARTQ